MSDLRPIVCVSTQYWRDNPFRKHVFMRHLAARGHRVLYVEPSTSLVRRGVERERGLNRFTRSCVWTPEPGILVMSPPRLLPKPSVPTMRRLNSRRVGRAVRRTCAKHAFRDAVLWLYSPWFVDALELIPHSHVVFDLVDDYGGYVGSEAGRAHMQRCMTELMRRADRAVVTSPRLAEKYAAGREVLVLPNGFDETLFHPGVEAHPSLSDRKPTIGFVGVLFDYIDYELLLQLVRAVSNARLVLVGRRESTSPLLEELLGEPNVHWVGPVPAPQVPAYVAGFDVCVAPFLPGEVADSVSPLKVYEYLAMRRPVVCTPMLGFQRDPIAKQVVFAGNGEPFITAVQDVLSQSTASACGSPEVLASCTWSSRFAQLVDYLGDEVLHV